MITAVCPNPRCNTTLPLDQTASGSAVTCPRCRQQFEVSVQGSTVDPEATTTPWLPGSGPPAPPSVARRGPPPLPPKPAQGKLRPIPTAVSALSALVILGSLYGTVRQFRSPAEAVADAKPAAERWAAVTVESFGVRLVVVDCTRTPGAAELALVHATNRDWQLGDLPPTVAARPPSFDELERVLAGYKEDLDKYGVPAERRLVACNSGVVPESGPNRDKLLEWLKAAARKSLGAEAEAVPPGLEAEYGARGSVPLDLSVRMQSVSLDMGGSSTKFGYFDTHRSFKGSNFKTGAKTAETQIAELARGKKLAFADAAAQWRTETADAAVRKLANEAPPLANYPKVYLLGGTPWAVAVVAHPEEFAKPVDARAVSIKLTPADVEAARDLVARSANFAALRQAVLAKVPATPERVNLEVELTEVSRVFPGDRLLAGATLLKSFADVCDFGSKEVRFYTRSLHAWPVGYILAKGKFE